MGKALSNWGWLAALAVTALALAIVYTRPVGVIPATTERKIVVAPASGIEGFDVGPFCADPLTSVRAFPSPDASGVTYQLTRMRDQKAETVTLVLGADESVVMATHYYDAVVNVRGGTEQQGEPAFVNADARKCVEGKAK